MVIHEGKLLSHEGQQGGRLVGYTMKELSRQREFNTREKQQAVPTKITTRTCCLGSHCSSQTFSPSHTALTHGLTSPDT